MTTHTQPQSTSLEQRNWTEDDRRRAVAAICSQWPYQSAKELMEADGDSVENIAVYLQMQLQARDAKPVEAPDRKRLVALIRKELSDEQKAGPYGAEGLWGTTYPDVLLAGCKAVGYGNPEEAAQSFAGFLADAILRSVGGDGWIRTEVRKPDEGISVLTVWAGEVQRITYKRQGEQWICADEECDPAPLAAFKYWQPLPIPPAADKEGK